MGFKLSIHGAADAGPALGSSALSWERLLTTPNVGRSVTIICITCYRFRDSFLAFLTVFLTEQISTARLTARQNLAACGLVLFSFLLPPRLSSQY